MKLRRPLELNYWEEKMKLKIGERIKQLRREKDMTQEQLARALDITSAAVSKWERGETYPDITALQPLAYYFGVSLDSLMGYDKESVEEEIKNTIAEYQRLARKDFNAARKVIQNAHKDYPNDYRIMLHYMYSFIPDAEPDPNEARSYIDEFMPLCDRIISECTDVRLCLSAWKMKAILLHAEGKTEEALKIHANEFGDWYLSTGQMNEQLFKKDRPEFLYWAQRNMYELIEYAADKYVKSIFYDPGIPYEEMVKRAETCGDNLFRLGTERNEAYFILQAKVVFGRLNNDLISREWRGGTDEDIVRTLDKYLAAVAWLSELATNNAPLYDAVVRRYNTDDLLSCTINGRLSWNIPRNKELVNHNAAYKAVLEKYGQRE